MSGSVPEKSSGEEVVLQAENSAMRRSSVSEGGDRRVERHSVRVNSK